MIGKRTLVLAALALVGLSWAAAPASAGVYVGVGVPGPYYRPYYRRYYYGPRVVIAAPPVVVAPAPVYVAPPPVYVAPPRPLRFTFSRFVDDDGAGIPRKRRS